MKRFIINCLMILLVSLVSNSVAAQGRDESEIKNLSEAAQAGDADAQYELVGAMKTVTV